MRETAEVSEGKRKNKMFHAENGVKQSMEVNISHRTGN